MHFEYQLQLSDEKYFLKERHRKTNIYIYVLFALLYFIFNIPIMIKYFVLSFFTYLFFLTLLALILFLCNFIFTHIELKIRQKDRLENYQKYHFSVTKRGITQSIGTFKKEILWKDIKKVQIRKKYIFIEPKNNDIAFLFQKQTLDKKYETLIQTIKTNMKIKI